MDRQEVKIVYLVNCQDKWCLENNNGDNIKALFLDFSKAKKYVEYLNSSQETWHYNIHAMHLLDDSYEKEIEEDKNGYTDENI